MAVHDRKCVSVRVPDWGAKIYTYWNHIDDLTSGEQVIIESPYDYQPRIATVTDVDPSRQSCRRASKWIVDRIDWDKYRALQALAPAEEDNS